MAPLFSLRGQAGDDPLDRLSARGRFLLSMGVTAGVTVALVLVITRVLDVVRFPSSWLMVGEVATFSLIFAPLVVAFRKSSSLLHYALVLVPLYVLDLYLEHHYRAQGLPALWDYTPGTFVERLQPPALRFLLTLSVDAVLIGPVCLWLSRLVARAVSPGGERSAGAPLFPREWTEEPVARPPRDSGFWVLRVLGLAYLGYLVLLLLGGVGPAAWPAQVRMLFDMTYQNAWLAISTVAKISLMASLAFVGAYHRGLRWTCTLAMFVGHATSVAGSLAFHALTPATTPYRDFLLVSAGVDGVMLLLFLWVMARSRKESLTRGSETLPASFSLPTQIWRYVLLTIAGYAGLVVVVSLLGRFGLLPVAEWNALFASPDPGLGNSLTLYVTLALVCGLMARSQRVREGLTGTLFFSLGMASLVGLVLLGVGGATVLRPGGEVLPIPGYLLAHTLEFAAVVAVLAALRSLYFNVEYTITSFHAPSAQAIASIHDALLPAGERADVLQAVDRYAAEIRGRKRGLINFPFWLVEMVLPPLLGLRPTFSVMSPEERKFFLRKRLLRPEEERRRAFVPEVAHLAFQLAVSAQSLVLFAAYAGRTQHARIGYVPPGARARLQPEETPSAPPPSAVAPLPRSERDPANWRPEGGRERRTLAPRVATPLEGRALLPDVVDYLIVGSGPGGAVMAYRLASAEPGASIAVIERGARYSPLQDFTEYELEMVARLYKEGGIQQTKRADMIILQGECVGGTSVINNAVCYRMPERVRTRWEQEYGLDLSALPGEYGRIAQELEIGPLSPEGINQVVRASFERAVDTLNTERGGGALEPARVVEANAPQSVGDGLWNLGNKYLCKRSMLETYIPWAEARGVDFIPLSDAVSFAASGRRVESLLVRSVGGALHRIRVRKGLVIAGGVIASSHLLMRSGVDGAVGQRMSCNFALPAALELPAVVDAFDGDQITLGSADPQGRAIFETYFNPPGAFSLTLPFYFDRHRAVMERYRHLVSFGALVGSESNGRIERRGDLLNGRSFTWQLGPEDEAHVRYALVTLLELARGAGARRVILPTRPGVEMEPEPHLIREFARRLSLRPLRMEDLLVNTAHPQGGNLMAGGRSAHASERVVDESFRVVGFDNVYVSDASVFPTSVTVNPQWTILALSSLAARQVLQAQA
ncbi:GMC family oxidoreductase N-terminal domain-containing protein [Hyalangium gracile]|uniref:GMC family oxidoreductase N-terminal domain-containing protein n=1 Tax=Hyalangium gracile TaxID=394092 RepID=UPI001CCFEA98|nr:GMC family oxidoreductase N-terminal domain-containing protein [Hyalangium gracile]